jgi:hypothetical protein
VDASINHQATGWLNKGDVKTALAGFFKGTKKVDRLDEVMRDDQGSGVREPGGLGYWAA